MGADFLRELENEPAEPADVGWWSLALNFVEDQQSQIRLWRHRRASAIARPDGAMTAEETICSLALAEQAMSVLDAARRLCSAKIRECIAAKTADSEDMSLSFADADASFKAAREASVEELSAEYRGYGWDDSRSETFREAVAAEIETRCQPPR